MHIIPKRVTLVHQVEGILRDSIRSNLWAHHLPGENELCHGLQVSRTTLRAALATLTRERWIRSSQGQRRQITKARETHKPKKSGRVVLITGVPLDLMGGTPLFLLDDLRNQLAKGGFELEVHASRVWFGQRPNAALERLVRERNPDAWVLFSTTAAIQRWFAARALPCVLAGSCHAGLTLPSVEADFHALGQHAAHQFLSRGHRRLALLVPALGMAGEVKMVDGFVSAAKGTKGVEIMIAEHNGTPFDVKRRIETLLGRTPPTGLLVAGATYMLTVMTLLGRTGVRIPEDLSVISRDSEPFLDYVVPSLTRYAISPSLYAQRLSRTVVALAQGGSVLVRSQLLLPRFIPGKTLDYLSQKNTSAS